METEQILAHPEYQALQRLRRRMSYLLTFANVAVYSLYVLAIAYGHDLMVKTWASSVINLGLWLTVAVIVFSFAISGFYLWWTNNKYDPLHDRFLQRLSHGADNTKAGR
ncbi:MAG: DUF485 domain-containing protein [Pseudomonadales bacterium]